MDSPYERYLKGLELCKAGLVKLGDDGWTVDTCTVTGYPPSQCDCPDYRGGISPCVHISAAREFIKNLGTSEEKK